MSSKTPESKDEIPTISIQSTDQMWEILSGKLEEFYQAWESNSPPELEKFLPERPLALRRFALNELIKVDLELRFENGLMEKRLQDYAEQFPELLKNGKIEPDLLFEEIELRKKYQLPVPLEEYESVFPEQGETLRRLLGHEKTTQPGLYPKTSIASLKTGSQVDDFELMMELGKGAFATVFLARQISMQRLVALKISNDRGDEPKTLAQLDCKNIVRVFDVRDISDPRCRLLYMKFVAGGSLHDVISEIREVGAEDRSGAIILSVVDEKAEKSGQDIPLDSRTRQRILGLKWFEIVFWLGSEIAEGLSYAHRHDVLHRDLKPANILMTTEAIPQIADFNVSFCSQVEGASAESFFGGSLAYMSPEQLEAFDPDHPRQPDELTAASDIYSLGIILWELMFGSRPFPDQVADADYSKLLGQLIEQRKQFALENSLPGEANRLDVPLDRLFESLLHPDPEKRINNAEMLSGELSLLSDRPSRELLRPKESFWSRLFQKQLVLFVVVAVVLPTVFAAVFNSLYNYDSIIKPQSPEVKKTFEKVRMVINAIAFPVGISMLVALSLRLYSRLKRLKLDPTGISHSTRKHILSIPLHAVIIPLSIWTVCGLAYPIAMRLGNAPITVADFFHFLTSLVLCGLIASVYPFFLIAYVGIRYWYPLAFNTSELRPDDLNRIDTLKGRVWFFMMLGVMLPTFSMLLMVITQRESDRFLLALLAGASFIALGVVFRVFQQLEKHLGTAHSAISKLLENRA